MIFVDEEENLIPSKNLSGARNPGFDSINKGLTTEYSKPYSLVILPQPCVERHAPHKSLLQLSSWLFFNERSPYQSPPVDFYCRFSCVVAARWLESHSKNPHTEGLFESTLKSLVYQHTKLLGLISHNSLGVSKFRVNKRDTENWDYMLLNSKLWNLHSGVQKLKGVVRIQLGFRYPNRLSHPDVHPSRPDTTPLYLRSPQSRPDTRAYGVFKSSPDLLQNTRGENTRYPIPKT